MKKKVNMKTKAAKYFVAHNLEGKTKIQAIKEAGISNVKNTTNIERTDTYQALDKMYAEVLQEQMSMEGVAEEHIKNIVQDQDKGAKNKAIQMFLDKVEPESSGVDDDDRMIVVLRA